MYKVFFLISYPAEPDHLLMYRRLMSPSNVSIDGHLVNHANRLGIKLKSSSIIRQSTAPPGSRRTSHAVSAGVRNIRTAGGVRSHAYMPSPTYIHDVVVPVSLHHSPYSLCHTLEWDFSEDSELVHVNIYE